MSFDEDRCDPKVWNDGKGLFHIGSVDKDLLNDGARFITESSEGKCVVDWHYCAGIAGFKYLGDRSVALNLLFSRVLPYWDTQTKSRAMSDPNSWWSASLRVGARTDHYLPSNNLVLYNEETGRAMYCVMN